MFRACLLANYANSQRWPPDCKVKRRRESNQISVLLNPAMNVHSEKRHPRQAEERVGKGRERKARRGSTVTRGRLTIADQTSDGRRVREIDCFRNNVGIALAI